jgi:hypothetical protein
VRRLPKDSAQRQEYTNGEGSHASKMCEKLTISNRYFYLLLSDLYCGLLNTLGCLSPLSKSLIFSFSKVRYI